MDKTSRGTNDVIEEALHKYANMVRRICYIYLHNREDVEDVFQEVFLKLLQTNTDFESEEHKKAWLCRITINKCKDLCKSFWRRNIEPLENVEIAFEDDTRSKEVMTAVMSLPKKYKDVVYLYYYEGYTAKEIANLLQQKENTVYSNLHRARKLLKSKLGGSDYEYKF